MTLTIPPNVAQRSRELILACDAHGVVTFADERATGHLGHLGPLVGRPLHTLCAPGTEAKLDALRTAAQQGPITGWELALVLDGQPTTISVSATQDAGHLWIVGTLIPEHFSKALLTVDDTMQESLRLHREVLTQKRELQRRNDELTRVTLELEDSNRGLLTLHDELADAARELRRQADIKARVVANVSHEFRTPLHSILGLGQLLIDESDGPITEEQRKQIQFIRTSAEELLQLVNDVLDLTRMEAGRATLRSERFPLRDLIASLRGMLRPLLRADSPVSLIWDEPDANIELETDRARLAQIVRNLVANALKFTTHGEVRVHTERTGELVRFTVHDTGIGIPAHALHGIFEEFTQVDSPLQARVQGSGLGLPLARQLAEALGGEIDVVSEPGRGSTFTVTIPRVLSEVAELENVEVKSRSTPVGSASILVVEDDRKTMLMYEKYLTLAGFHVVPARSIEAAQEVIATARPVAIVLDIMLENETSWNFLAELKRDPRTADIPVLVCTVTNREQKARALGADEFWLKPIDPDRLLRKLQALTRPSRTTRVLIVDDDERARYLMAKHLTGTPYELLTAETGAEGVELARTQQPQLIFLDFLLRETTAFDVLDQLKADPRTRAIPVVIVTSQVLDQLDRERLLAEAEAVISKEQLSRELAIHRIRDALAKVGITGTTQ